MKIGAVVLAAGQGRRFGGDKLRADLGGRPVVDHVLDRLAACAFDVVICVVRPDSRLPDHLKGRPVVTVVNPDADQGMGTSLAVGIGALTGVDAAFIVLGDMPWLPGELFGAMAQAMLTSKADIVVPVHGGQQGHPVLFAQRCFADLMALQGDAGAKSVIRSGRYAVARVEAGAGILRDVDVPGDLSDS